MDAYDQVSELQRLIFHSILDPAMILDREGIILSMNHAWLTSSFHQDKEQEHSLQQSYEQYYEGHEELLTGIKRVLAAQESVYELNVAQPNQSYTIRVLPLKDHNSSPMGALVMYVETKAPNKPEEIFKIGEKEFKLVAEHSMDMIKVTDVDGRVEYASPSHLTILGYDDESSIYDHIHPEDVDQAERISNEIVLTKESRKLELRKRNSKGEWKWLESVCSPVLGEDGAVQKLVYITRDITVRRQRYDELERMAYFDSLTDIYSRRKLRMDMEETLKQCAKNGDKFAILIMDLDNFKWVNDTYGHDVGDLVLREFASRLLRSVSEVDVVGRLGGDEFSIIMKEIQGTDDVQKFIQRFQRELSKPYLLSHTDTAISLKSSVGYAIYPSHGRTIRSLLKVADHALYKHKRKPLIDVTTS